MKKNQQARALFHRAGTATVAVAVDTRPKIVRNRKAYTRKGRQAQRVEGRIHSGRFE